MEGIAIIGVDGRFPGAATVEKFWQNLCDGTESIAFFSDEELTAAGVPPETLNHPNYIKAGSVLSDVDLFDASFFGFSPREAQSMDPQHRLLLQCAWGALENAGYNSETYDGRVGVYTGSSLSTYLRHNLLPNQDFLNRTGELQIEIGNDKDFVPTRISYKMNLKGPSVCINTACSSSLVAVHIACQGLLDEECDMALAGGVTIQIPQTQGYWYQEDGIASPDGHCRPFDAKAQGTIFGSGLGIVVLKRLEDALADQDHIYAVIKGSAINNDGSLKVGYTAPSVDGQAEAIAEAYAIADIEPETVSYIEAHGTATGMGDPIEVAALNQVFQAQTDKTEFCAIGSVKGNIGHLNRAAGIIGLIKTTLALKHQQIPPSLHFEQSNPQINFGQSPFYVNTQLQDWQVEGSPRRAGVSSFGIGGTNAHAVLEEAPTLSPSQPSLRPWQLLVLSAKTKTALNAATQNLALHFQQNPDINLADTAFTLQVGRQAFTHRRMLVVETASQAIESLDTLNPQWGSTSSKPPKHRPIVFMFSGQGAQYVNMAQQLYQTESIFRSQVDQCAEILKPLLDLDLRQLLYPAPSQIDAATAQLKQTGITQPALFVIEYALAQLWMAWGIQPQAMIGHSIGEYVAACIAGVFTLEDALALVAARGKMMQALPSGSLLAVFLPEQEVRSLLTSELSLAANNAPSISAVSGPNEAIDALEQRLHQQEIDCRRLHTSHAFHSQMMDPILDGFTAQVGKVALNPPQIPYISNVTGTWISAAEATDPSYWAQHLRQAVRFSGGVQELLQDPDRILLEVGPGQTLKSLAKQQPDAAGRFILSSVRHPKEEMSDVAFQLKTLGELWLAGVDVDWSSFYREEKRYRIPLPTYPFDQQRHWVEPTSQSASLSESNVQALISKLLDVGEIQTTDQPLTQAEKFSEQLTRLLAQAGQFSTEEMTLLPKVLEVLAAQHQQSPSTQDWFYQVQWQPKPRQLQLPKSTTHQQSPGSWLIFSDQGGISSALASRLDSFGQQCIFVVPTDTYQSIDQNTWGINPTRPTHFGQLLQEVARTHHGKPLQGIIHLWSIDAATNEVLDSAALDQAQSHSCGSILHLVQALNQQNSKATPKLWLMTQNAVPVVGNQQIAVAQAPVWGLCKTIALEHPEIWGGIFDVSSDSSPPSQNVATAEIEAVLAEILHPDEEEYVAHRNGQRYVPRLVRHHQPEQNTSPLDGNSTYLITGGLGALGLKVARWMVDQGARHLVLLGRKGPSDKAKESVAALEELGTTVKVIQADVTQETELAQVFTTMKTSMPALRGIVHTAGIQDDGVLLQQDWERFTQVTAPKVRGAWALHTLSKDIPLDFFVCFSSIASVLGAVGKGSYGAANTFLDALAHYRQGLELPSLSINWGPWADVGMATALKSHDQDLLDKLGFNTIPPDIGVQALADLLSQTSTCQMGFCSLDWPKFIQQHFSSGKIPGFLSELTQQNMQEHAETLSVQDVMSASPTELPRMLGIYIHTEVAKLLGIESSKLDKESSLINLGLDSMMAIQLRNTLKGNMGVNIPMVQFMEGLTVNGLTAQAEMQLREVSAPAESLSEPDQSRDKLDHQNQTSHKSEAEQALENLEQLADDEVDSLLNSMLSQDNHL
ncbi:type I polyketide synthase [Acaryochloris sp. IP29b_bin.148]|uniref:type I polyketide synthase n=1 Tax=Acaryochloris sp. IP29b_bin.148 TaxID=2969218 RepID=UPI00261A01F0|nr:type I polyketide synthase [Acaryochloris sp. IP29b_bin.148]